MNSGFKLSGGYKPDGSEGQTGSRAPAGDLLLVGISLFTWGLGEGMFLYFQPIYLEQLGADPLRIGAILSGFWAAMTLAHIPAGYLSDRFGRRGMMWLAWLLGVISTWMMALAGGLPAFTAGLLLYGLTGFVVVPINSYATAARGRWSVGRTLTLISATYSLGMVAGPLAGGLIAQRFGLQRIFLISAVIFILSTLVILFIRPQPVERAGAVGGDGRLFPNPGYLRWLGVVFLAIFAAYLAQPLSQNYLRFERGLSLATIGGLTSLTGLGIVLLNLGLGALQTRRGFLLAQAAVGGFAVLLWRGGGLPAYALGYFLLGGYKTARSLAVAQTRSLVQVANMGLAYGVTETVSGSATILASLLAGWLYGRSPSGVYACSALLLAVSLLAGARFSSGAEQRRSGGFGLAPPASQPAPAPETSLPAASKGE